MSGAYFNFSHQAASTGWDRGVFLRRWWRLMESDPRWAPPYYPALRAALEPNRQPYLLRQQPVFVSTTAVVRPGRPEAQVPGFQLGENFAFGLATDRSVAATALLSDPRRQDASAYLALLHVINDLDSLESLLAFLGRQAAEHGRWGLIGPTGLSPHLGSGVLIDGWHRTPPLFSAYNPPYLPELLDSLMAPLEVSRLYHLALEEEAAPLERSRLAQGLPGLELMPLEMTRLASDLLPLLQVACSFNAHFPPPDQDEAAFLLQQLHALGPAMQLHGWLAQIEGRPVGFMLLGADLAPLLKRFGGGRSLLGRFGLRLALSRQRRNPSNGVQTGRIFFGGVLPAWRRRGIASRLLGVAWPGARQRGWVHLNAGPLPEDSGAEAFFLHWGAQPAQRYRLYRWDF